jgi:enoyl-CoA hydratase/carnithine racemase
MSAQPLRASVNDVPILLREMAGAVAVLTLNRPVARNSLSEALIAELHAARN